VLIALDAKTGNEVWKAPVEDYNKGYYMSLAPLVADGKVIVGVSGGELGVRGFVAAFDSETGKPAWKTYPVPGPGEPGSETWPTGDQWKTGGGSVWYRRVRPGGIDFGPLGERLFRRRGAEPVQRDQAPLGGGNLGTTR
jgi:outer membrane protein assembly factor BamB